MNFYDILAQACKEIGTNHFLLPVAGRDKPLRRERVYCYELYHQLRKLLPENELTLTGEPDKSGHRDFGPGRQMNPDFIFHIPGNHQQNVAVVEVECRVSLEHLTKDLRNLKKMQSIGYRELILLLFAVKEVPWSKLAVAAKEVSLELHQVKILLHSESGSPAALCTAPDGAAT